MKSPRIILIGERDLDKKAHLGIEASLALYRREANFRIDYDWVNTAAITPESVEAILREVSGIWCTPGSPYENTSGALLAIQYARVEKKAFLGTCGGFQHALMEFAENVLKREATHQELAPAALVPLIVKLSCSLIGAKGNVIVTDPEFFSSILGATQSIEEFNCSYGMNTVLEEAFNGSELRFVARDEVGQVRAFRLRGHPFFVGTLFQPERKALASSLHPVVRAFFEAII